MVLMWVVPVGLMTTIPAQALSGDVTPACWPRASQSLRYW